MHRSITGFHRDDAGDWVADLDCGHGQHVRHRPPFQTRPWVTTSQGRDGMLGSQLDCVRCEAMEWPENLAVRRRTPEFTETSVPAAILRDHATKRGVWGRIHVLEGALVYRVGAPIHRTTTIAARASAIIVPEVRHHVEVDGRVRFLIEFSARVE